MLDDANVELLAQRLDRVGDLVDLGGVAQIGELVDDLRRGSEPALEFGRPHLLIDHLVQQQNLRRYAGRKLDKMLANENVYKCNGILV
jgi:hypothetical protein